MVCSGTGSDGIFLICFPLDIYNHQSFNDTHFSERDTDRRKSVPYQSLASQWYLKQGFKSTLRLPAPGEQQVVEGNESGGCASPWRSQREETLCSIRSIWITTMRACELPQPWAPSQFCWGSWQWWATQPNHRQAPLGGKWEEAPVASSCRKVCA